MPTDPLDDLEQPTLAERIEPYRKYGDTELALALRSYEWFGGPGRPSTPAAVGYDYHCPECDEDVRGVSRPDEGVLLCPLCGHQPGLLTLGTGPTDSLAEPEGSEDG